MLGEGESPRPPRSSETVDNAPALGGRRVAQASHAGLGSALGRRRKRRTATPSALKEYVACRVTGLSLGTDILRTSVHNAGPHPFAAGFSLYNTPRAFPGIGEQARSDALERQSSLCSDVAWVLPPAGFIWQEQSGSAALFDPALRRAAGTLLSPRAPSDPFSA